MSDYSLDQTPKLQVIDLIDPDTNQFQIYQTINVPLIILMGSFKRKWAPAIT